MNFAIFFFQIVTMEVLEEITYDSDSESCEIS